MGRVGVCGFSVSVFSSFISFFALVFNSHTMVEHIYFLFLPLLLAATPYTQG